MCFSVSLTFKLRIFDSEIQVYLQTFSVLNLINHVIEHYLEMRLI